MQVAEDIGGYFKVSKVGWDSKKYTIRQAHLNVINEISVSSVLGPPIYSSGYVALAKKKIVFLTFGWINISIKICLKTDCCPLLSYYPLFIIIYYLALILHCGMLKVVSRLVRLYFSATWWIFGGTHVLSCIPLPPHSLSTHKDTSLWSNLRNWVFKLMIFCVKHVKHGDILSFCKIWVIQHQCQIYP